MKIGFYPHLAWDGIRKNKRLYIPYILTGSLMVMMYYILSYLVESPTTTEMAGARTLATLLPLGCVVIAIFSLLFLFYTHAFLIKQRYREFGLYNVLGMDKHNLSRLLVWENLFTAALSLGIGLIGGIAFSKGAELIFLNLLHGTINYRLQIGVISLRQTVTIYAVLYLLPCLYSLGKLRFSKPLALMQSSSVGERIPRFTGLYGLLGVVLLGVAYYMAVSIEEPATALFYFFVAVVLVIVGTYLVFISGSVAFCRLLQKNKRYYYKPNHFVSVSSMVYRMKRNGAGLASICILLTMVLVMLSSTATLYFGEEDSLQNRYPYGINVKIDFHTLDGISDAYLDILRADIVEYAPANTDLTGTRYAYSAGQFTEDGIVLDYTHVDNVDYDRVGYLYVTSLADYNAMMGENKTLAEDECFLYSDRLSFQWENFTVEFGNTYRVKERLTYFREDGDALAMTMPSLYLVVNDLHAFSEPLQNAQNDHGDILLTYEWLLGFDCADPDREIAVRDAVENVILENTDDDHSWEYYYVHSQQEKRAGFFQMYSSLFFLGIMLSVVFLLAAVSIMYYKQLSEGYEDQKRFDIMQKVGMTPRDIRESIHSQMLTIFYMPLVVAGVHLSFAFPFVAKILELFAFTNLWLNIGVTAACFLLFGLLYAIVYKITSEVYYSIVCGKKLS